MIFFCWTVSHNPVLDWIWESQSLSMLERSLQPDLKSKCGLPAEFDFHFSLFFYHFTRTNKFYLTLFIYAIKLFDISEVLRTENNK